MAFNPYFFCDSPLPMEVIQKALMELGELKPTVDELKAEVDKLIADLDGAIQDEVQRVIDEMYQSGEFDDILETVSSKYIDKISINNNNELDFRREFRKLYPIGDNYRYSGSVIDTSLTPSPSHMQGATYITYNGADYYIYCLDIGGVHSHGDYNAGVIVAYKVSDGTLAGQIWVNMEHMNSIDYNTKDQFIYVASNFATSQNTAEIPSSYVYRFHITELIGRNLNISNFIQLKAGSGAGAYQPIVYVRDLKLADGGSNLIQYTNCISYNSDLNDNEIYVMFGEDGVSKCVKYNFNTNTIIEHLWSYELSSEWQTLKSKYNWTDSEGKIVGIYMYFLVFNPSMILRINLKTQKIEHIYNFPQFFDGGRWAFGEPEALKVFDNGDIYIFTSQDIFSGIYKQFRMSQVFKQNLNQNISLHARPIQKYNTDIHLDRKSTDFNPDGTKSKPFQNIVEAVFFANNNDLFNSLSIQMHTNSIYYVQVTGDRRITITTASDYNDGGAGGHAEIGGLSASSKGELILDHITVRMSMPDINLGSGKINQFISIWGGSAYFDYVLIIENTNNVITTAYNLHYCNVRLMAWGTIASVEKNNPYNIAHSSDKQGVEWTAGKFFSGRCYTANCGGFVSIGTMPDTNVIA